MQGAYPKKHTHAELVQAGGATWVEPCNFKESRRPAFA